jgi:diguanylate cyclase (GGDEF)-like protein/PAS domain S-box-containing protein
LLNMTQLETMGRAGMPERISVFVSRRPPGSGLRPASGLGSLARAVATDPVVVAIVAGTVVIGWLVAAGAGSVTFRLALSGPAQVGQDLLIMWFSLRLLSGARASGMERPQPGSRAGGDGGQHSGAGLDRAAVRFWRAISVMGGFLAVGDIGQTVAGLVGHTSSYAVHNSIEAPFFMVGAGVVALTMFLHPIGGSARGTRLRFWLDAGTVLCGVAVFLWFLMISPQIGADLRTVLESLGTAAGGATVAFGVLRLALSGNPPVRSLPVLVGVAAALAQVVAEALTPQRPGPAQLGLVLALRLVPGSLVALFPRLQQLQLRHEAAAHRRRRPRRFTVLPYVAMVATFGLVVVAVPGPLGLGAVGALVGMALISGLVIARQLVAFIDNANLVDRLDASLLELGQHETRLRALLMHSSDITLTIGGAGEVSYISPAVHRVLGISPDAVLHRPWQHWVHPADRPALYRAATALTGEPGVSVTCHLRVRHADGNWRWLEVIATNLLADPVVGGVVCNAREVTEARELHDRLRHEATHDPLTQLANRALFTERLNTAADGTTHPAVLLIDLDEFKPINDELGHHVGDAVLVAVAGRLRGCLRAQDTAARLGGDEFAVVLPATGATEARAIAARVQQRLTQPVNAAGHLLRVRASIGVAAGVADEPEILLRRADAEMYRAKAAARAMADPGTR